MASSHLELSHQLFVLKMLCVHHPPQSVYEDMAIIPIAAPLLPEPLMAAIV